jgi:hypothetical protein
MNHAVGLELCEPRLERFAECKTPLSGAAL